MNASFYCTILYVLFFSSATIVHASLVRGSHVLDYVITKQVIRACAQQLDSHAVAMPLIANNKVLKQICTLYNIDQSALLHVNMFARFAKKESDYSKLSCIASSPVATYTQMQGYGADFLFDIKAWLVCVVQFQQDIRRNLACELFTQKHNIQKAIATAEVIGCRQCLATFNYNRFKKFSKKQQKEQAICGDVLASPAFSFQIMDELDLPDCKCQTSKLCCQKYMYPIKKY